MFPRSSLLPLLDKTHSKVKHDQQMIESTLTALTRIAHVRPDLFSLFCSLCGAASVTTKLKSYQLAINHRQQDEIILLHNQACKDLSAPNWNVALIAYHFLFYTNHSTESAFASDIVYLINNEATRRAALNSLHYQAELLAQFGSRLVAKLDFDQCDLISKMRLIELEGQKYANIELSLHEPLHQLDYIGMGRKLNQEEIEPEVYFEQLLRNHAEVAISLVQFRRQLRSLCTLRGDRAVRSAWSATLNTIGYVLDNRSVLFFFSKKNY